MKDFARQCPITDQRERPDRPPFTKDYLLPIGPFRMWLRHQMSLEGASMQELAGRAQLNERSIRRIMDSDQQNVSLDLVDWALTKSDGRTQLWHLYPECYDTIDSDMEISS